MKCFRIWLTMILAGLLFLAPVYSDPTVVEAEDFVGFTDVTLKPIQSASSPGCHGGKMLAGLDYPNEWTAYDVTIDRAGDYKIDMLCRGDEDRRFRLEMALSRTGSGIVEDFSFTFFGRGYG